MTRQDQIIAVIRTGVPALIGWLLAYAIAHIPAVADIIAAVDSQLSAVGVPGIAVLLQGAAVAATIAGYYWLARKIGHRYPVLEKWLLGRSATPTYAELDGQAEE